MESIMESNIFFIVVSFNSVLHLFDAAKVRHKTKGEERIFPKREGKTPKVVGFHSLWLIVRLRPVLADAESETSAKLLSECFAL